MIAEDKSTADETGRVVLQTQEGSRWLSFDNPLEIIETSLLGDVRSKVEEIERKVKENHLYAAGYLAYESAPAFDEALKVRPAASTPLLWFGLYEHPLEITPSKPKTSYSLSDWRLPVSESDHHKAISKIHDQIASGKTYQVNYTFRQTADFQGDPWALFLDLNNAQQASYGAFLDCGRFVICSASPELFFSMNGPHLIARPMKGTVHRGLFQAQDQTQAEWLRNSLKNQAENVMIVDMIRNDLGRISRTGSVNVSKLFELERYPTIWQMTSTVESRSDASFAEILSSLFPCASITGAPKVSTMNIIASLEKSPRGVYTGCIGYLTPDRQGQFNVAIRTVVVDKEKNSAEYGVGGGIVWDSISREEYQECLTKSLILKDPRPEFQLLESLLWEPNGGYFLLEEHLDRLENSALYFGCPVSLLKIRRRLKQAAKNFIDVPQKVRLLLNKNGRVSISYSDCSNDDKDMPFKVSLANAPVNSQDLFLYHKTTHRRLFNQLKADHPELDDVILWNERGEITESTIANVVINLDGRLITPPVESGLLAGTFRRHLLEQGQIEEDVVSLDDIQHCQKLYIINSVRRWLEAELIS